MIPKEENASKKSKRLIKTFSIFIIAMHPYMGALATSDNMQKASNENIVSKLIGDTQINGLSNYVAPQKFDILKYYRKEKISGQQFVCLIGRDRQDLGSKRCRPYNEILNSLVSDYFSTIIRSLLISPELRSNHYAVESNQWLVRQMFASWYPNIALTSGSILLTNISNTQNYGSAAPSTNPSASGNAFQPVDPISTSSSSNNSSTIVQPFSQSSSYLQAYPVVTLNWNIINPPRADTINAAKAAKEASEYNLKATARTLSLQIAKLYANLQAQEYTIAGYLEQAKAASKILNIYESQYSKGVLPLSKLLTQRSQYEQTLSSLSTAVYSYKSSANQLTILMGYNPDEVEIFFPQTIAVPQKWPLSLEQTKKMIREYPAVVSLVKQSAQYKSLALSSQKSYLPTLSLLGYITYIGTRGSTAYYPPAQPQGAWSSQLASYIGLNLTWKFFDGFASYQSAKAYENQSKATLQQGESLVLQTVSEALADIATLNNAMPALEQVRSSYRISLEALQKQAVRVQIGFDDPTSTYQLQQSIGQIINSYSNIYAQLVNSYFDLLDVTGGMLTQNTIVETK